MVEDVALANAQALLLHLQELKTYALAHTVQDMRDKYTIFDSPTGGTEQQSPAVGSHDNPLDNEQREHQQQLRRLNEDIAIVKSTLAQFDDYLFRKMNFSRRRAIHSGNYIHAPDVINTDDIWEAGTVVEDLNKTRDERERLRHESRSPIPGHHHRHNGLA